MANIETNDFSKNFDDDFYNDIPYIADRINEVLDDLARDFGGQLSELNRNFSNHRSGFMEILENIVGNEVIQRRRSLDDVLVDAILAGAAVCAKTIRRGTRESEDWVAAEFSGNPFLEDIERSSRRERPRSSGGSDRYGRSERRNAGDYHRRRSATTTTQRTERDDTRRNERRRVDVPRGRIAAITKPDAAEPVETTTTQYTRSEPVAKAPEMKAGDVVISSNFAESGVGYGLLYIAGDEQVVFQDGSLEITEFGASEVDYEQHRIDRFYPDILGGTGKTELTAIALREAEKVKDQTINRFVNDPANPDNSVDDPKLFQYATSGSYTDVLQIPTKSFSPVDIRDSLVELHTGDLQWFAKHALFVKVEQVIDLTDVSNDCILRLKNLINGDKVLEIVSAIVQLSDKIDPVVWRILHDYITTGFNKRLVSLDLNIIMSSITADWMEFRDWLQNNKPEFGETLNMANGITSGLHINDATETTPTQLIITRNTLFLPIHSYDLDFASATASEGFAVLTEQSKIFKFVNDLMNGGTQVLYVTTMDGKTMAFRDISGVMGGRYFVTLL